MDTPFLRAQHYSDEAQKYRHLAAIERIPSNANALSQLAESYDRLARHLLLEGTERNKNQP